ncbi:MAG: response regulator [Deltaproteobacteria bacterium]|nr:response regulator [Deltaproteobacteria bacterium]
MNPARPPRPVTNPGLDGTVARILAVDDHRPNLLALEAILDPLGVDVVSVTSGEDALIEILRSDFALILMDVQMPKLDGFATTSLIKKRQKSKHVPVIFLTAISREEEHIFQGYAYGAVDYLVKPFDPAILRAKVGVFVDLWTQKQIVQSQERELVKRERDLLTLKSDARFHELANSLHDILWAVDARGKVYFANVAAKEYLGGTGRPEHVFELSMFHPDDAPRVQEQWRNAIASGEPFEWQARLSAPTSSDAGGSRSAEYRWHVGQGKPERTDGGAVAGWIATAADIEDRKRAEQVLSCTARVSHELRGPLFAILAAARGMLDGEIAPDAHEAELRAIIRCVGTQSQIVDELVEVSKITLGDRRTTG